MRVLGIAAFASLLAVTAAHSADCKIISYPAARLVRFDNAAKVPAPKAQEKVAAYDVIAAAKTAMQRKLTDPAQVPGVIATSWIIALV